MIARLVTPPATEPVTLAEAKEHLRIIDDAEDAYVTACITAARQMVESGESWSLERSLINATWRVTLDRFPSRIELPRPPLVSVSSITYLDTTNTSTTLSSSLYTVDTHGEPGRIVPAYSSIWPETLPHINAVTITYVAGYGSSASDVPQAIRQAILLCVGDLFELRQSTVTGTIVNALPAVRALLNGYQWRYR